MKNKIFYGKQSISKKDIISVSKALSSDKITQGYNVDLFEKKINAFFGSKYSLAVSSGTAALHLSILALNLKKTDKVLTSPISFIASANCAEYAGINVEFCDIEKNTNTLDVVKVEKKLKKDSNIKVVIAVDYAGHPANWKVLNTFKKKYGIILINDNCHALGAKIDGNKNYATKYADIVTQSFHPVKHITTGEGGAILTNNKKIYDKIKLLRNHGIKRSYKDQKKHGMWFYKMDQLGFNYRISDINCALGISQLNSAKKFILKRRKIAKIYEKLLKDIPNLILPNVDKKIYHSYHLYPVKINFSRMKISKKNFFNKLAKLGIYLQVHYIPIYRQPYYKKKYNLKFKNFPESEIFYAQEVSLPIYYNFNKNDQKFVCEKIKLCLLN